VGRLRDLDHVLERARVHGIKAERLQSAQPTVSLQPCPACRDGFDALLVYDGFGIIPTCNGCGDSVAIANALIAEPGAAEASPSGLRLYTPAELLDFPEPEWLVEPFIVSGGFSVLFGPSGTYKSFAAVAWAAKSPGVSVYVSGEGSPRKFGDRVAAWERSASTGSGILCVPHAVNLLDPAETAELSAALRNVGDLELLVVDTASRNMAGGDENSTRDMALLVSVIDKLRRDHQCAALVLHHSGHENTDRERGSSALRGAADFSIRAKKQDGLKVRLECAKVRDFEPFLPVVVNLVPIGDSLVACEPITPAESLEDEVRRYLSEHPGASQNDVEKHITGGTDAIRAAYKKVRQVRQTGVAHPGIGAPKGVRPIEGAPLAPSPLDFADAPGHAMVMSDPDEWARNGEDGGW
jgi:AAA domain